MSEEPACWCSSERQQSRATLTVVVKWAKSQACLCSSLRLPPKVGVLHKGGCKHWGEKVSNEHYSFTKFIYSSSNFTHSPICSPLFHLLRDAGYVAVHPLWRLQDLTRHGQQAFDNSHKKMTRVSGGENVWHFLKCWSPVSQRGSQSPRRNCIMKGCTLQE